MGKIRLLEQYMIDRIAAGEVVQRPMNVVKELVENSIDASASAITVEIKEGGISYIRVTDNGVGMDEQDALMSFKRHATSKIAEPDDLDHISTLGFRGEALSAISTVSHLEIATKSVDTEAGIRIKADGGVLSDKSFVGVPDGTTIIVRDLFYNTPARLKFLKSKGAEAAAVSDLISRLILANPGISFHFVKDDQTVMHSTGDGTLISAVTAVYGGGMQDKTLPVHYRNENIRVVGLIGVPQYAFKNRKMQSVFINGRYVISDLVDRSVYESYSKWLVPGLFPFYLLNISLPPDDVDVNIHPNKLEIKFKNEPAVKLAINEAVYFALSSTESLPKVTIKQEETPEETTTQQAFRIVNKYVDNNDIMSTKTLKAQNVQVPTINQTDTAFSDETDEGFESESDFITPDDTITAHETFEPPVNQPELRLIGIFKQTYQLVEYGDALYIVDQHAAHERIIFDQLMESFKNKTPNSQILLIPETVTITLEEKNILSANQETLQSLGFILDIGQDLTVSISAVPSTLTNIDIESLLDDVYDAVDITHGITTDIEAIIMRSCKRAVKAGEHLPFSEAKYLVEELINSGTHAGLSARPSDYHRTDRGYVKEVF